MPVQIRHPTERTCERCGREEQFDEVTESWVVTDADAVGGVYCIHEWDINGSFVPFENPEHDSTRA